MYKYSAGKFFFRPSITAWVDALIFLAAVQEGGGGAGEVGWPKG